MTHLFYSIEVDNEINMNYTNINNLADPTTANQATTKTYVDSIASGLNILEAVRLASQVDLGSNSSIASFTYNSTGGTSTRGQITGTLNVSDVLTIDGISIGAADDGTRILLKNQTTADSNGLWYSTISGTSFTLDRTTDFDQDSEAVTGSTIFIQDGAQKIQHGHS